MVIKQRQQNGLNLEKYYEFGIEKYYAFGMKKFQYAGVLWVSVEQVHGSLVMLLNMKRALSYSELP